MNKQKTLKTILIGAMIVFTILSIFGCIILFINNKQSLQEKFEYYNYENYNGNYRFNGENGYQLFNLSSKFYLVSLNNQNYVWTYYWNIDKAGTNNCMYDFKENKIVDSYNCNDVQIQGLKELKNNFNEELKRLNITIKEIESNK